MTEEKPQTFPWTPIGPGEVVYVNKKGRRERGEHRECQECGTTFVIAISGARGNPSRGKFCSHACRNRNTNRARKERDGYAHLKR